MYQVNAAMKGQQSVRVYQDADIENATLFAESYFRNHTVHHVSVVNQRTGLIVNDQKQRPWVWERV